LQAVAAEAGPAADRLAPALLQVEEIFGTDLPRDRRFTAPVTDALASMFRIGAKATVEALIRTSG
jgi:fructuronate reductase